MLSVGVVWDRCRLSRQISMIMLVSVRFVFARLFVFASTSLVRVIVI